MFDFHFVFLDGTIYDVKCVTKMVIVKDHVNRTLQGDDMIHTQIPINDMYLYTSNGCVSISGKNLLVVSVLKQDV